jgi:hypothetical protein
VFDGFRVVVAEINPSPLRLLERISARALKEL